MAWIYLVGAGLLEIFWATCLKLSHGFSVWKFTILTIIGMIASFVLLAQATKTLPLGTAYAIWTGIGAVGTVIVGILTVSYTHLDVYKRQPLILPLHNAHLISWIVEI